DRTFVAVDTPATKTVLVKPASPGDADLNGVVNSDDYFYIDSGFASQAHGFAMGDFNLDGKVNADDYFLIDRNYSGSQQIAHASSLAATTSATATAYTPQKS